MTIFHHSCGFIIFSEIDGARQYLLLRYPEGHFDFPKGHIEDIDTDRMATALRELKEETGLTGIEVVDGFEESMQYNYKFNNQNHEKSVDFFLGRSLTNNVTLSHEHREFVWLPFADALKKVTFDNARKILSSAEGFLVAL